VGRVNGDVLTMASVSVPVLVGGVLIGALVRSRISPELFRRLVVALLVGMSIMLIGFTVLGIG